MSRLKKIIAKKLNSMACVVRWYGTHKPEDILFCRNGNRTDVVRWMGKGDLHCFSAAYESTGNNITFKKCDRDGEIYIEKRETP